MYNIASLFTLILLLNGVVAPNNKKNEKNVVAKELREYYENPNDKSNHSFHRQKAVVRELVRQELYVSPTYLTDSIAEISRKNLNGKITQLFRRAIQNLPDHNFVKLVITELMETIKTKKKAEL